jgi:hypothetical protein
MQDNKYYTPSLYDFFYGLEYEFARYGTTWQKFTFNEDRAPHVLMNVKETPEMFRIPYLQKEDIEAEGFKFLARHNGFTGSWREVYKKEDLVLDFCNNQKVTLSNGQSYEDYDCYFNGTIKNKSELKRILKMIGV